MYFMYNSSKYIVFYNYYFEIYDEDYNNNDWRQTHHASALKRLNSQDKYRPMDEHIFRHAVVSSMSQIREFSFLWVPE